MEKPHLEVVVVSEEGPVCLKHLLSNFEEEQFGQKRPRLSSPVCPMEWEASPQPDSGFFASSLPCPPLRPLSTQLQRKPPCQAWAPYDPNDFTSDELDPALEWPRESPPARKYKKPAGRPAAVWEVPLLQSILGHFPLGLRLEKLVTLLWKEHKVHLWRLSVERGYGDLLRFLEEVPGVRLSMTKGGSRYLVRLV